VFSVAFSPDGKLVAVGDNSGTVVLWDPARGVQVGRPLVAHNGGVGQLSFSPDGRALATAQSDGSVRLWNVATRKLTGAPLPTGPDGGSVSFLPDGKHLLGTLGGGTGTVWTIDPRAWESRACTVAGRELTQAEWSDFLGGRAYADVCPRRVP
jgi:WD40 repeat protein